MGCLFVFLDGVGLGESSAATNPFVRFDLPAFAYLAAGARWTSSAPFVDRESHLFKPIDATLGLEGLPQSGTGQATLFTGVNCAAVAGRHFGPFPHSKTKPVIARHNLFTRLYALEPDARLCFANAYPDRFFDYLDRRNRWTVTTLCCREAGVRLRRYPDLIEGNALTADLTGAGWRGLGYPDIPIIDERQAGQQLARIARQYDLTLFEYFFTDKAGHSQSFPVAERRLRSLDTFFAGLRTSLDPERDLLLISSDHGNLEDLSVKTHTLNPVPLIAYGAGARYFRTAESLTDVVPALERWWVRES